MTTYPATSPEDHFNDELEAIVAASWTPSGIPAPDVHAAMPTDFATVMHRAASAADAREWATLDRIWDAIENDTAVADDTAELPVVPIERNGSMHQTHALTPPNGTAHPIRDVSARPAGWMGRISQGLATAMVIALLIALVGGVYLREFGLPTGSGDPTRAPGLAASPEATSPRSGDGDDLLIVRGLTAEQARRLHDRVGVLDTDGLTIYHPNTDPIALPDVNEVVPFGVPGQAMITTKDASRAVIDLTSGETLHRLPDVVELESYAAPYLFLTESGENADWTVYDLRTGESHPLSDIVELPADQPVIPVQSGPLEGQFSPNVYLHFVTPEYEISPTSDIPWILIAGSLDRAMTLNGYSPASQAISQWPVVSPDSRLAAWIASTPDRAVVVTDVSSGAELARFDVDELDPNPTVSLGPNPQIAGFTIDGGTDALIVTANDRILRLTWEGGNPEQAVNKDELSRVIDPILYSPDDALYFQENGTLQRMTLSDASISEVVPVGPSSRPVQLTRSGGPWVVVNLGGDAAMLDARTGEIVSQLRDVPPNQAEFDVVSFSMSVDGSVVVQEIGGSHSGYLVSPQYPDGLVLTAPIGADVIAATDAPDGIPVTYQLSADGKRVVAGTVGNEGYTPRFMAQIGPDPDWTPIDTGVSNLYWLPTSDRGPETSTPQTLPAQDVATEIAREAPSTSTPDAFIPTLQSSTYHIVNLFAGPTVDAEIFTGLPPGTPLMALGDERTGDDGEHWIHVRTERGDEGWIVERYLEPWITSATVTPPAANPLSCASPGYLPVIAGDVATSDLAMIGFDGQAIVSTDDGVTVPLPDGTTRMLPPESDVLPDSNIALAVHDDNSATVTRIPDGESWSFEAVEPRLDNDTWDFFSNGRYVIGPASDERTDWIILDTLTGNTRTTSDILGEPFEGSFDPLLLPSSDNGDVWVIQFAQLFFSDLEETPPPDTGADPPGYLVIPESLDDAWFSDQWRNNFTVSPSGETIVVNQVVRDAKTGERVDSGGDNLTYFGELIAYLDESTLLTFNNNELQTVDVSTGATTTIHTARGRIQNAALDADAGMVVISSGTHGPIEWVLIDLTTGEVTPLPDLAGYQLANTSGSGGFARVDTAAAFFQYGAADEIEVRALDIRTGAISPPVTARTDSGEAPSPWSHVRSQGQYVHTTGDAGTVTFIDAPTGDIIQIPPPENVSIPNGDQLGIAIVPGERCATLTLRDASGQPVGNTWVAPIETGATWMELPFSIDGWRTLHIQQGQTPPAQDLSTPISNDATSAPTSEAFAPMSSVPGV